MNTTTHRKRPIGFYILISLLFLYSLAGIITIVLAIKQGNLSSILLALEILIGIFYLSGVFLVRGLSKYKRWAFWGTVIFLVFHLIAGLVGIFRNLIIQSIIVMIVAMIMLIYMFADRTFRSLFSA